MQEGVNQYNSAPNQLDSLRLYHCGFEHCQSGHSFGPAVRDHILVHCVLAGSGVFYIGDQSYHLKKGQGFLILPGIVTTYTADTADPWYYCWVGFNGNMASEMLRRCGLRPDRPIFPCPDTAKVEACVLGIEESLAPDANSFRTMARLFDFLALLSESCPARQSDSPSLLETALDDVARQYSYGLTVAQLAQHIGVDRSQLFRIFKKSLGMSPQEYILDFKLRRAAELLRRTDLDVVEVMYSCGFSDLSNFTRQFRRAFSQPPAAYRRSSQQKP